VNRTGFIGGVERILLTLATGLDQFGWHPVLACPDHGELAAAARADGIQVAPSRFDRMRITANACVLAGYPLAWARGASDVERHCRDFAVDLIHVQHPVTSLYARRAAHRLSLPVALHVHETLPARLLYAVAGRVAVKQAAATMCVSGAAQQLALSLGADPARIVVVPNGIDGRFLRRQVLAVPAAVRTAGPGPHIGVFGTIEPRKAQHILLEAAKCLASRFPSARFWIVGKASLQDKQAYARRLTEMADSPQLRGRVCFPGFDADVAPWLRAMDIVVQPSVALESFGMAVAEAMALGRPVVATRVGGLPEVVSDGRSGILVPPHDAASLAAALAALLEDPARRRQMGETAARDARTRFAPDAFSRAVAAVYNDATSRWARG
jgi:glycosyltransferase involved in cell wall biosynthesis